MAISRSPTFASLRQLSPHLLHALQHHVAVSVESFHSAQKLLVVPAVNEHLGVVLHGICQNPEKDVQKLLLKTR